MKVIIKESRKAEKDLDRAPKTVQMEYEIWARLVEEHGVQVLRKFKGYHDEVLKGALKGKRSSRLSKQWRVIYSLGKENNIQIMDVIRVTPHDYRVRK